MMKEFERMEPLDHSPVRLTEFARHSYYFNSGKIYASPAFYYARGNREERNILSAIINNLIHCGK